MTFHQLFSKFPLLFKKCTVELLIFEHETIKHFLTIYVFLTNQFTEVDLQINSVHIRIVCCVGIVIVYILCNTECVE
jgi:hypothetical protein